MVETQTRLSRVETAHTGELGRASVCVWRAGAAVGNFFPDLTSEGVGHVQTARERNRAEGPQTRSSRLETPHTGERRRASLCVCDCRGSTCEIFRLAVAARASQLILHHSRLRQCIVASSASVTSGAFARKSTRAVRGTRVPLEYLVCTLSAANTA